MRAPGVLALLSSMAARSDADRPLADLLRDIVGVLRKDGRVTVDLRREEGEQLIKAALGLTLQEVRKYVRPGVTTAELDAIGGADPFTPTVDIEALRGTWADRDDCEIVVYPEAEHGFVHDADRLEKLLAYLRRHPDATLTSGEGGFLAAAQVAEYEADQIQRIGVFGIELDRPPHRQPARRRQQGVCDRPCRDPSFRRRLKD